MAEYFKSHNIIYKRGTYIYEDDPSLKSDPIKWRWTPVVKTYQVDMSYADKYRLGILTYQEYYAWMQELEAQAAAEEEKASGEGTESKVSGKTFWANDTGERTNLSADGFKDFLAENSVDISNSNTVDIASLLSEVEAGETLEEAPVTEPEPAASATEEVDADAIMAQVNKDIHGDTYLTQEEIEALFAAANAGQSIT